MYLRNLTKAYISKSKDQLVFDDTSLDFSTYKSIALIGRSGSGKTTLFSILAGLDIKYQGEYSFHDQVLLKKKKDMCDFRYKNISIISQRFNLLNDRNVFENIALSLRNRGLGKAEIKQRVNEVLDLIHLQDLIYEYPQNLSGGEQQRIAIARALVTRTEYILADEPTSELDEQTEDHILEIFKMLQ